MKVIKIDIKQETMDVEKECEKYLFFNQDDIKPFLVDDLIGGCCLERSKPYVYKLFKFYNPYGKKYTNYLINVNEKNLIDIFLKMEREELNNYLYNAELYGLREGNRIAKENIKKLPWYKRLFNNF